MNNNFFQSNNFKKILYGVGIAISVLIIFQAGMFVGYRKAGFSYQWGDNYYRTFGGHRGGEYMMGGRVMDSFRGKDFTNSNGVIGKIVHINFPTLTIENSDGIEKIILINNDTVLRKFRETIKIDELKIDDFIVAIGAPNESGQIESKILRVMPNSETFTGKGTKVKLNK